MVLSFELVVWLVVVSVGVVGVSVVVTVEIAVRMEEIGFACVAVLVVFLRERVVDTHLSTGVNMLMQCLMPLWIFVMIVGRVCAFYMGVLPHSFNPSLGLGVVLVVLMLIASGYCFAIL